MVTCDWSMKQQTLPVIFIVVIFMGLRKSLLLFFFFSFCFWRVTPALPPCQACSSSGLWMTQVLQNGRWGRHVSDRQRCDCLLVLSGGGLLCLKRGFWVGAGMGTPHGLFSNLSVCLFTVCVSIISCSITSTSSLAFIYILVFQSDGGSPLVEFFIVFRLLSKHRR